MKKILEITTNENGELIIEGLTVKESEFFIKFLANNGCGAKTPDDLLSDNFSCQCIEDLREVTELSNNEIGGLLSSLEVKGMVWLENRSGPVCKSNSITAQMNFEPDLYWVSDGTLEELTADWDFVAAETKLNKFKGK